MPPELLDANGQPVTPPAQAQGAPAANETERPMTRAEFVAERNSMFADMRRMVEGIVKPAKPAAPAPTATPTEPAAPTGAPVDVNVAIRREREISEAMGDHPHLGKEQRALLRRLIDAEKPEDVSAFITAQAKLFIPPAAGTSTPNPAAPGPTGRPVSDGGGPASAPAITEDTPLWKLDSITRDRLLKEKGYHWYRETLRAQAKGQKVRLREP